MSNTEKNIAPKAIYQVINYFYSELGSFIPTPVGFYTSKEEAIEVAGLEWTENGNWCSRLAVPYPLYKRNIDRFKDEGYTDFHDYRGYTKEEWKEADELVNKYERQWFECTAVVRCTLDSPTPNWTDNKQIWEKRKNETCVIPCEENGKWGFRDEATGKYVVPPAYLDCIPLKLQYVNWNENWNDNTKPEGYEITEPSGEINTWRVKADNGKWGVIDEDGELIIPVEYDEIGDIVLKTPDYVFKVYNNGKYRLIQMPSYYSDRNLMEISAEYDEIIKYNIEGKSGTRGLVYATVRKNDRQKNIIINEDGVYSDRQRLLDSWFEWSDDAIRSLLLLNTAFIEAETNANQEYAARKAELKLRLAKGDNLLTDYEIRKKLNLAILVEDDNGELEEPTEGIYAKLNKAIAAEPTGFFIDSTQDWAETLDPDVAKKIYNAIPDDLDDSFRLHYAFHVLHSHLFLAWEDILKIRSVWAEVEVVCQKNIIADMQVSIPSVPPAEEKRECSHASDRRHFQLIKSILFGVSVGDALGVPVEFCSREELRENPVTDMTGGEDTTHSMPAGTWSDDSSLAFCLAESLTHDYNLDNLASLFVQWRSNSYWTAHNEVFDVGCTCSEAISRLARGVQPELAGCDDEYSNGNGSLMRILPLLSYMATKPGELHDRFELARQVSSLTHRHIRSIIACFYYLEFALRIYNGHTKDEAYKILQEEISSFLQEQSVAPDEIVRFDRLLKGDIKELTESEIRSSGYVIDTLEASIWCLLTTDNYKDAVLKAVNLGGDTDTVAAVTGGLAGIVYGFDSIPQHWIAQLARRDDIEDLAKRLTLTQRGDGWKEEPEDHNLG